MAMFAVLLVAAFLGANAEKPISSPSYQRLVNFYKHLLPKSPVLLELWQEHLNNYTAMMEQKRAVYRYPVPNFNCHTTTPWGGRDATSVHNLHPGDVKVVGAIGDSLTAGNGIDASNILGDLVEYRGLSWSIGGDGSLETGELTLPNILKKFDRNLYGYSLKTGGQSSANAMFNLADPGDTSYDMPGQARMLIDKMKADKNVDFLNDWKVITVFVGGNDLCDSCHDTAKYAASNYGANIRQALDLFHKELPRTFVNLATIFDIAPVAALSTGFFCSFVHALVCDCGDNRNNAGYLRDLAHAYQNELSTLVASGRYDTRDDFTVVLQPFFTNTEPPPKPGQPGDIDMTFFSPDCFHFSGKGHGAAALSLWNNMIEAVGHKQLEWHLDQPFLCPGSSKGQDHWFFATTNN
ncbi:phospholipase B1, membrane-associated-like isoform X2 [Haliotis asinina]